jgi:hypothetical protein
VVGLPESELRAAGADAEFICRFNRHCGFVFRGRGGSGTVVV